jgi:amino acid transporter
VALIAYTAVQVDIYGYIGMGHRRTVLFCGGPQITWRAYSFAILAIVALLGFRHIDLSLKVLGVALVLEIGVVVVLDLVIRDRPECLLGVRRRDRSRPGHRDRPAHPGR